MAVFPDDAERVVADLADVGDVDLALMGDFLPFGRAAAVSLAVGAGAIAAQVAGWKFRDVSVAEGHAK